MSANLIPNRMLFDFEFPLQFRRQAPRIDGSLSDWTDAQLIPRLSVLDGVQTFASVWACWNETGLFVACRVDGKRRPLRCDPKVFWKSDNLRLCTDMRDARQNKRATRFCQQFYFLPTGGGSRGDQPVAGSTRIHRAREDAPLFTSQAADGSAQRETLGAPQGNPTGGSNRILVASSVSAASYRLEAHVPGHCLAGFDPLEHPRIGFYYMLEDRDHGQQYLTVGDDLNWYSDPSTWATCVLAR